MIDELDPVADALACGDMWAAVLLTAIADAHGKFSALPSHCDPAAVQAEARAWFEEAGPDFLDVCIMAGADPEMVRRVALGPVPVSFNHRLVSFRAEPICAAPNTDFTPAERRQIARLAPPAPTLRESACRPRRSRTEAAECKRERNRRNYLTRKARHTTEEWKRLKREQNERCRNRRARA